MNKREILQLIKPLEKRIEALEKELLKTKESASAAQQRAHAALYVANYGRR